MNTPPARARQPKATIPSDDSAASRLSASASKLEEEKKTVQLLTQSLEEQIAINKNLSEKYERLRRELNEYRDAEHQTAALAENNKLLQEMLRKADKRREEEVKDLKKLLGTATNEITELKSQLRKKEEERSSAVAQLEKEMGRVYDSKEKLGNTLGATSESLRAVQDKLEQSLRLQRELEGQVASLNQKLSESKVQLEERDDEIETLRATIELLEADKEKQELHIEELAQKVQEMTARVIEQVEENTRLRDELRRRTPVNISLEMARLHSQVDILAGERDRLEKALTESVALRSTTAGGSSATSAFHNSSSLPDLASAGFSRQEGKQDESADDHDSEKAALQTTVRELNAMLETREAEIQRLYKQLDYVSVEHKREVQQVVDDAERRVHSTEKQLRDERDKVAALQEQIKLMRRRELELKEAVVAETKARALRQDVGSQAVAIESEVALLKSQLSELQHTLEQTTAGYEKAMRAKRDELVALAKALENANEARRKQHDIASKQIAALAGIVKDLVLFNKQRIAEESSSQSVPVDLFADLEGDSGDDTPLPLLGAESANVFAGDMEENIMDKDSGVHEVTLPPLPASNTQAALRYSNTQTRQDPAPGGLRTATTATTASTSVSTNSPSTSESDSTSEGDVELP